MLYGVIQLLDSAQGRPLQTWRFENQSHITIGRADENDIVLADPYVSRAHAYLQFSQASDEWRLISISHQKVVYQDLVHGELTLTDGMVFRLGQHGCYLRFGQSHEQPEFRKTVTLEETLTPFLMLDKQAMQRQVDEIIDGEFFQSLKNAAGQRRRQRPVGVDRAST